MVAEAAHRHEADRFIFVSTDKAVNPVSVMGASKGVAELLLQELGRSSKTIFASVRFGNVLGSNGSVIPLFLQQIKAGGPVTITDPRMRRYFMLIGEAVHLLLHAARLARGGELFVLEMGEQISVVDMARNLIRLAGFVPDEDIALTYLGSRPGEKLVEELVGRHETVETTSVEKVLAVCQDRTGVPAHLSDLIMQLEEAAAEGSMSKVVAILCDIVPTYHPRTVPLVQEEMGGAQGMRSKEGLTPPADAVTLVGVLRADPPERG